jgi:hypothetical protein
MGKTKRFVFTIILVLSFLGGLGVSPAQAAEKDVQFLGAKFVVDKGLLVMFKVFDESQLDRIASVTVNGDVYALDCRVAEDGGTFFILRCVTRMSPDLMDSEATILYGDNSYTAILREPRPWCYPVFDFGPDEIPWGAVGVYCQVRPAAVGDFIEFHNPNWPLTPFWIYRYDLDSDRACGGGSPNFGDGYYFFC